MLKKILILVFFVYSPILIGMESEVFDSLISDLREKNYDKVETFLNKNKKKFEKDPEYYVVLLNYVSLKGETTKLVVAKGKPTGNDAALHSKETGKVEGFLREQVIFDKKLILSGIKQTQNALRHFPKRLDIHFGIVAVAERMQGWNIVGDQIVEMLRLSKEINNDWVWGKINSMEGNPKEFMIQNILPRTHNLFRMEREESDKELVRISEAMIKYYPKLIYGYSNLGVLHMAKKEYPAAEKYLNQALKIDPNDEIVKGNLEHLKKLKRK